MEKNFDINQQGYSIRCKLLINDNDKQTLLVWGPRRFPKAP